MRRILLIVLRDHQAYLDWLNHAELYFWTVLHCDRLEIQMSAVKCLFNIAIAYWHFVNNILSEMVGGFSSNFQQFSTIILLIQGQTCKMRTAQFYVTMRNMDKIPHLQWRCTQETLVASPAACCRTAVWKISQNICSKKANPADAGGARSTLGERGEARGPRSQMWRKGAGVSVTTVRLRNRSSAQRKRLGLVKLATPCFFPGNQAKGWKQETTRRQVWTTPGLISILATASSRLSAAFTSNLWIFLPIFGHWWAIMRCLSFRLGINQRAGSVEVVVCAFVVSLSCSAAPWWSRNNNRRSESAAVPGQTAQQPELISWSPLRGPSQQQQGWTHQLMKAAEVCSVLLFYTISEGQCCKNGS